MFLLYWELIQLLSRRLILLPFQLIVSRVVWLSLPHQSVDSSRLITLLLAKGDFLIPSTYKICGIRRRVQPWPRLEDRELMQGTILSPTRHSIAVRTQNSERQYCQRHSQREIVSSGRKPRSRGGVDKSVLPETPLGPTTTTPDPANRLALLLISTVNSTTITTTLLSRGSSSFSGTVYNSVYTDLQKVRSTEPRGYLSLFCLSTLRPHPTGTGVPTGYA